MQPAQTVLVDGSDVFFQTLMVLILFVLVPVVISTIFIVKRRNKRLQRIEEKVDQLLSEKKK
ncbi:hypothetical protein IM538_03940 [Cytobacillus suaedae]|nr:hypothetical protein IM538_03940 [Cytobacillus suaedae]